ncbi:MAG: type II secretion system protein, partial [Candidatus Pacebacteria bacterium]|nr:type II secretion system protein [Candidatus Paceibacterota bacterium]
LSFYENMTSFTNTKLRMEREAGFTLLELLIVISIIAILSVALIFVLNPTETLRKSRDAQRISDMATIKTALGIYTTGTTTPYLAGVASNAGCKTGSAGGSYGSGNKIYYSLSSTSAITDTTLDAGTGSVPAALQVTATALTLTDATGWLPVSLDSLIGGSPISSLPIDPVNIISDLSAVSGITVGTNPPDYVYRYACNSTSLTYEIDSVLESTTYTTTDNKMAKDGGNNANYYEVGTNLKILGTGTDF